MKNILFTICALIVATPLFGQIPRGTSTIGGSISGARHKGQRSYDASYSTKKMEMKTTTLSVTPSYGYFVVNNLCIGINVNLSTNNWRGKPIDSPELKSDSWSIGAGPQVRYYLPLDSKLYAYGAASYSWHTAKADYAELTAVDGIRGSIDSKSTQLDAGLGLSYFINPRTAVETGVAYTQIKNNSEDNLAEVTQKTKRLALNIGFRIFLRQGE